MKEMWYLAGIPPRKISDLVDKYRQQAAREFRTERALRSPVHLTLVPPFHAEAGVLRHIQPWLRPALATLPAPVLQMGGFGTFEKARVLYLSVEQRDSRLENIYRALQQLFRRELQLLPRQKLRPLRPHFTLLHRGVSSEDWPRARKYFAEAPAAEKFELGKLSLLRHDGQRWQEETTFALKA